MRTDRRRMTPKQDALNKLFDALPLNAYLRRPHLWESLLKLDAGAIDAITQTIDAARKEKAKR